MSWICSCGHVNPLEANTCRACRAARPTGLLLARPEEKARYRSLASVGAWAVAVDAVVLYGRRFLSLITASALMVLPLLLYHAWQWRLDWAGPLPGLGTFLLMAPLFAVWNAFWVVLMIRLAADEIEGTAGGLGEAVARLSVSTVAWAVIAQFLVSLLIGLASLLLLVPGIIVAVRLSLTLPVIVCEGRGPIDAMGQSRRLVKGHGWSVFGAFFLLFLASTAASIAAGAALWAAKGPGTVFRSTFQFWAGGGNTILQTAIGPLWAIVPTLFYEPLRSERDADLPLSPQGGTGDTVPPAANGSEEP